MGVVQDGWGAREPVHNLQRSLLQLVADRVPQSAPLVREQLGQSWLNSATLARKEMLIPCCDSALQNASIYSPPQFKVPNLYCFFLYFYVKQYKPRSLDRVSCGLAHSLYH